MKRVSRLDTYYPHFEITFELLPFLSRDESRNFHRIAHELVPICMMRSIFDDRSKLKKKEWPGAPPLQKSGTCH